MDIMGTTTTDDAVDDAGQEHELDESRFNDRDREMLELERTWWKYEGAKTTAIRERFDLSPTRYYQRLNWLLDRPEAVAYDPMTVRRLQRLRDQRQRQRSARRLGVEVR